MDEADNCEGLLRKALAVQDVPDDFDPNKVPQTGEEYLHYVMYEARQCKEWVTASIDKGKLRQKQPLFIEEPTGFISAPSEMLPSLQWQQKTVSDFSAFRLHIQKLKLDNPIESAPAFNGESDQWLKKCSTAPKLTDVLCLNQRNLCKILNFHLEWLENINNGETIAHEMGAWLYAILACLDTPLMPDTCANMREMARKCSQIRAALPTHATVTEYKPLNLFICIIARYFKNFDLVDDVHEI
ncbi:Gemin 2 [Carabus blaptoides fortunei]